MNTLDAFNDIADDKLVMQVKSPESALAKLLRDYEVYANRIDHLPNVTDTLTGASLKGAIGMLEAEDQVKLAYLYYGYKGMLELTVPESEADRQSRNLWHRVIMTLLYMVVGLFVFVMGCAFVYIFRFKNMEETGTLISGILSTAAEIAKILLSIGER